MHIDTLHVENTGDDPLMDIVLTDDRCSPVDYVSGDNGDDVLDVGEAWTYTCSVTLDETTTNTATVTGTNSLGSTETAQDTAKVNVGSVAYLLLVSGN